MLFFFFFFSSRRRHTRWPRDWSSDVCSSDLEGNLGRDRPQKRERAQKPRKLRRALQPRRHDVAARDHADGVAAFEVVGGKRGAERDGALEAVLGKLVGAGFAVRQAVVEVDGDAARGLLFV